MGGVLLFFFNFLLCHPMGADTRSMGGVLWGPPLQGLGLLRLLLARRRRINSSYCKFLFPDTENKFANQEEKRQRVLLLNMALRPLDKYAHSGRRLFLARRNLPITKKTTESRTSKHPSTLGQCTVGEIKNGTGRRSAGLEKQHNSTFTLIFRDKILECLLFVFIVCFVQKKNPIVLRYLESPNLGVEFEGPEFGGRLARPSLSGLCGTA